MPRRFDHVVFDLDGTLIDSQADLAASANFVLRSLDLPELSLETVAGFIGNGARRLIERALAVVGDDRVDLAFERFLDHYGTHLLDRTGLYVGVEQLLDALAAAGVRLSVLTNKPEAMSVEILKGLGQMPHFDAVVGGDSLPTRKPDPAGLRRLQGAAGSPSARMLLVGDSVVDVETARAAGIACCGVTWGLAPEGLRAAAPEFVIDRPQDLLAIVLPAADQ